MQEAGSVMNGHTPLPWSEYHGDDTHGWSILLSPEGFEIGSGDGGFEELDAKLIIAAVNNHHKLVKALQAALKFIDSHAADPDLTSEMIENYAELVKMNPKKLLEDLEDEND